MMYSARARAAPLSSKTTAARPTTNRCVIAFLHEGCRRARRTRATTAKLLRKVGGEGAKGASFRAVPRGGDCGESARPRQADSRRSRPGAPPPAPGVARQPEGAQAQQRDTAAAEQLLPLGG